ncbi:MAG: hypothetical protein IT425_09830 [Pirellulales bacterium]|nr:hypothetical protein [Pirellulales bacterium]
MNRNPRSHIAIGCAFFVLVAALGCSPAASTGMIRGTVTLNGTPLEEGAIQFTSLDGSVPTAGARIENGKFETDAALSKYRVQIESNIMRGPHGENPDLSKKVDKFAERESFKLIKLVPDKYNTHSKLELEVKSDINEPRFELTSE